MVKIKKNDQVIVIAGQHKGKQGRVLLVDRKKNRLKIDKINIVKKHIKPTQNNPDGGIKEFENFIHISNVSLVIKKGKEAISTKVGFIINQKGHKKRIAKKTGKEI